MSGEQRAYVRVYWSIIDDPKFAEVYDDDRALACWLRLLIAADQSWPASASIPLVARKAALDTLVRVGLVDIVPGSRYRIHGLDRERDERSSSGRNAAALRWQSVRNATASDAPHPDPMPSRAEPSRAKPSIAREGLAHITFEVGELWEKATGRPVLAAGAFASDYLDDACRRHGEVEVRKAIAAARYTFTVIPTPQQLAVAVRGILDPLPDSKVIAKVEREKETAKQAERRAANTLRDRHEEGWHNDSPDHRCPLCKGAAA